MRFIIDKASGYKEKPHKDAYLLERHEWAENNDEILGIWGIDIDDIVMFTKSLECQSLVIYTKDWNNNYLKTYNAVAYITIYDDYIE